MSASCSVTVMQKIMNMMLKTKHIEQYCVHERPEDDVSVNFNCITCICNLGPRVLHKRSGLAKNLLLSYV